MILLFVIVTYVTMCVESYMMFRSDWKKDFGKWTNGDRISHMVLSIFGPFSLMTAILVCFIGRIHSGSWMNKEVKW